MQLFLRLKYLNGFLEKEREGQLVKLKYVQKECEINGIYKHKDIKNTVSQSLLKITAGP